MVDPRFPWGPATATGVGPVPGTDPEEGAKLVFGEIGDLPHVPELPSRGAGADPVGRTAALLVDMAVELRTGRWRVASRPGADQRRAADLLLRDLDALEAAGEAHQGPVKAQAVGPWTLAASLELPNEARLLSDRGAVADLAASLAEGLAEHAADLRERLPGATGVLVELDEGLLADVVRGGVPTASGWGHLSPVEELTVEELLAQVVSALAGDSAGASAGVGGGVDVGVRLGPGGPLGPAHRAGARFAGLSAAVIETLDEDSIGEAVEDGMGLLLGLLPPTPAGVAAALSSVAAPARRLWRRLGFDPGLLGRTIVVTPTTGLDDVGPEQAVAVLARCRELALYLAEAPEDESG
ncbi:MAG: methionine synthase [Acidimicrobiales bacterium]